MNNKPVLSPEEIEAMNAVADFMGYSLWNQGMPASIIMRERRAAFIDCFELLWPMVKEVARQCYGLGFNDADSTYDGPPAPTPEQYLTSVLNKLKSTVDGK